MEAAVDEDGVTNPDLAKLWRCHTNQLTIWRGAGLLPVSDKRYRWYWYTFASLDQVVRQSLGEKFVHLAHGIPQMRTLWYFAQTTGRPATLSTTEAARDLNLDSSTLLRHTYSGEMPGFRLPSGTWRYPTFYIEACVAIRRRAERTQLGPKVPQAIAQLLLGINPVTIKHYTAASPPLLECVEGSRPFTITLSSVLAYLETWLVRNADGTPFITPMDWSTMRLTHRDKLLSLNQVIRSCRTHHRVVNAAIMQGDLVCLRTPGGELRIPEHAVNEWQLSRKLS